VWFKYPQDDKLERVYYAVRTHAPLCTSLRIFNLSLPYVAASAPGHAVRTRQWKLMRFFRLGA